MRETPPARYAITMALAPFVAAVATVFVNEFLFTSVDDGILAFYMGLPAMVTALGIGIWCWLGGRHFASVAGIIFWGGYALICGWITAAFGGVVLFG